MTLFTWKFFVWSAVAGLSILAGLPTELEACCFSRWWGGGGYSAGYPGYYGYGAGYYGGYYGPSYYGGYYGGGCCGGCSSCGPSCGYGCAPGGLSCASCAGGGCGVTTPSSSPPAPMPDDGFRGGTGTGTNPADNTPAGTPPRRRRTPSTFEESTPPGGAATPNTNSRRTPEAETSPETDFERPFGTKSGSGDSSSKKLPAKTAPAADPDAFTDEPASKKSKANRPNLTAPGDSSGRTIIPQKKPTIDIPDEETAPKPNPPKDLKLDNKSASRGVAPKTRMTLAGQVTTPRIVRLKLRPDDQWLAAPATPVIARH